MISFIVPVKNGLAYTRALVESVRAGNPEAAVEWVVVDSGSTDGTAEYCREIGAKVVPLAREPFNYSAAIDAGAAAAAGSLWIVANNDIEFRSTGDLARLERLFREWPVLAAASPGRTGRAGGAGVEFRLDGLNGACWAVRPEAFRAWGGLPEALSGYGYDEAWTQLCLWECGLAHAWVTGWDVFHHGSATFGPLAGTALPALRRNLRRLLALRGAEALERGALWEGWDPSGRRVVERLYSWERARLPARLLLPPELAARRGWIDRQGYAAARAAEAAGPTAPDAARVFGEPHTAEARQWLPWLANELLLQPEAPAVGGEGWYAVRGEVAEAKERPARALFEGARAVGPPPPPLLPPLPPKRPTLRQQAAALLHAWRHRRARLPEEW